MASDGFGLKVRCKWVFGFATGREAVLRHADSCWIITGAMPLVWAEPFQSIGHRLGA